ncbi:hypothetical protein C8R43DRAFT_962992 [Mycena crocata]|nr:hypothetical protein C8R43DRAFT_962992 [Mycena crocata]
MYRGPIPNESVELRLVAQYHVNCLFGLPRQNKFVEMSKGGDILRRVPVPAAVVKMLRGPTTQSHTVEVPVGRQRNGPPSGLYSTFEYSLRTESLPRMGEVLANQKHINLDVWYIFEAASWYEKDQRLTAIWQNFGTIGISGPKLANPIQCRQGRNLLRGFFRLSRAMCGVGCTKVACETSRSRPISDIDKKPWQSRTTRIEPSVSKKDAE